MATAPSFATYKVVSEAPFIKGGKLYITVEHPNTKNHRDVRWYTDAEYEKLYGAKLRKAKEDGDPWLKHARGFDEGPILIIRNDTPDDDPWLRKSSAYYAVDTGWYVISTKKLEDNAPKHFKYLRLYWDEMRDGDDNHVKSPQAIRKILNDKAKRGEWVTP